MLSNTVNPLLLGDSEKLAERIASMLPTSVILSDAERARHAEENALWVESRFGPLPDNTYRILDYHLFGRRFYFLELAGEQVILRTSRQNEFEVYGNLHLALTLSRSVVAAQYGDAFGESAVFFVVFSGAM